MEPKVFSNYRVKCDRNTKISANFVLPSRSKLSAERTTEQKSYTVVIPVTDPLKTIWYIRESHEDDTAFKLILIFGSPRQIMRSLTAIVGISIVVGAYGAIGPSSNLYIQNKYILPDGFNRS